MGSIHQVFSFPMIIVQMMVFWRALLTKSWIMNSRQVLANIQKNDKTHPKTFHRVHYDLKAEPQVSLQILCKIL